MLVENQSSRCASLHSGTTDDLRAPMCAVVADIQHFCVNSKKYMFNRINLIKLHILFSSKHEPTADKVSVSSAYFLIYIFELLLLSTSFLLFQTLFKNPQKLMNLVKNVGSKLDEKMKSGDI